MVEVVVIGAGPYGLSAAAQVARRVSRFSFRRDPARAIHQQQTA